MGNSSCVQGLNCNRVQDTSSFEVEKTVKPPSAQPPQPIRLPKTSAEIDRVLELKASKLVEFIQHQSEFKLVKFDDQIYQGQTSALNLPHGLGKMYKADGSLFVGRFSHGKADGQGLYILKEGSYFQGIMKDNTANCENGVFHCKDYTYKGGFKDNVFFGSGEQISERYKFKGTYVDGLRECGELKWWSQPGEENQYCYYGKFDADGYFTDEAILKEPTGKYNGNFLRGKKHGEGVYRFNNSILYEGQYYNGVKEGQGKVSCVTNGEIIYEGNWKDNLPYGEGCRYDQKGNKEKTYYVDGINVLALREPQDLLSAK